MQMSFYGCFSTLIQISTDPLLTYTISCQEYEQQFIGIQCECRCKGGQAVPTKTQQTPIGEDAGEDGEGIQTAVDIVITSVEGVGGSRVTEYAAITNAPTMTTGINCTATIYIATATTPIILTFDI